MRFILKYDRGYFDRLQIDRALSSKIENAVLRVTLLQFYNDWISLANAGLNSTKIKYINSIKMVGGQSNRNTGSIYLDGWLANAIEDGISAFDMKTSFSNSAKKKFNKKGEWYLTIPLSEKQTGIGVLIENDLTLKISELVFGSTDSDSKQSSGQSVIGSINQVFDYYRGRTGSKISEPARSVAPNFRRVGQNSSPESWIHTGIAARQYGKKALEITKARQEKTITNIALKILKENK